jgi:hypothetical protein
MYQNLGKSVFISSDSSGKGNVLRHQSDSFGMIGAKISILEQVDNCGFAGFLKG